MPAEPKTKLKRRPSRRDADEFKYDGVHARELEQKRNRGMCCPLSGVARSRPFARRRRG